MTSNTIRRIHHSNVYPSYGSYQSNQTKNRCIHLHLTTAQSGYLREYHH